MNHSAAKQCAPVDRVGRQRRDGRAVAGFVAALLLILGAALVMAIVYNQTRVALSERGRELASLRVLGFSRREVARMLLGEQGVLLMAALPVGLGLGWLLTLIVMIRFEAELFRLPVVVDPVTYLEAAVIVVASAVLSALLVRRRPSCA